MPSGRTWGRGWEPAQPARRSPGPWPLARPRPARGASWVRGRGGAAPLSGARPGGQWPPGLEAALRRSARRVPRPGMAALLPAGPPPDELDFIQAYEEVREKHKGTAPPAPRTLRATCRPAGPWQVLQPDSPASDPLSAVADPIAALPPRGSRSDTRGFSVQRRGRSTRRSPRGHALNRASRGEGGGVGRACYRGLAGPVSSVPSLCPADRWVKAKPSRAPQRGASPMGWGRPPHLAVGHILVASPHIPKRAST